MSPYITPVRMDKTFEELAKDEVGTIYYREHDEGLEFLILHGPSSLCAYVGVPKNHPLAGHSYDHLPVRCHGGLTYGRYGGEKSLMPDNKFWYGWDYAHSGDRDFRDRGPREDEHAWTVDDVKKDSQESLWDFHGLIKLSESIYKKAKWEE